jgi:glycogen operon protein
MPNPPLIEAIAEDPMLAATKIIAEAWDAAGAYQVGSFGEHRWNDSHNTRHWAEWNGRYRDDVRGFWRGDAGLRGAFATRLAGSSDLYEDDGRPPASSINFITSHDGFTLHDLVSYRFKHNEANGEGNRDGDNNNLSENFGVEGPTEKLRIQALRGRQVRNMLASLMLSQGVPMLVSGDECGRTQHGNNNAYCQDNPVSWFDWDATAEHAGLLRFTQALIAFRKKHAVVRSKQYLTGKPASKGGLPDVSWFDSQGAAVDWDSNDLPVVCLLSTVDDSEEAQNGHHALLLLANPTGSSCTFILPPVAKNLSWKLFIDTNAETPKDVYPDLDGPELNPLESLTLEHHALQCFVASE